MKLTDSSAANVGANAVRTITSATSAFRQFMVYSATTISSVISGAIGLIKNGTGTLITTAANTYTGGTTVNAGTLQIGNGTNITAKVLGTTTLNGGDLAYHLSANIFTVSGAITLAATGTITKLGTNQINLQTGTLNGGGQTLNLNVAGTLYFNGTAGTSLGQINILNGIVGQDGIGGLPLRTAAIDIASGAQFQTYTSPTINNNITLNGGAGPNGNGALYNSSVIASHTPIYTGIITLASSTNSSFGNTTSGFTITGQITGSGSFTKIGTGTLTLTGNNTYTGTTTISAGMLTISGTGQLGSGNYSGSIANTGSFIYSSTADQILSGTITGIGQWIKNAVSTLTLSGTFSGTTGPITVNAGTLALGANQNLPAIAGAGNINIGIYNLVILTGTINTFSGVISGSGSLRKMGSGSQTLSGNLTYTGSTQISSGTLRVTRAFGSITPTASFGSSTLVVSFTGTFPSGTTEFRFFQGTTINSYASVTLTGVPVGTTATYNSANSTLSVTVP